MDVKSLKVELKNLSEKETLHACVIVEVLTRDEIQEDTNATDLTRLRNEWNILQLTY